MSGNTCLYWVIVFSIPSVPSASLIHVNIPFSQPKCHQVFPPWDHTGQNQIPLTTMSYYISFIGNISSILNFAKLFTGAMDFTIIMQQYIQVRPVR